MRTINFFLQILFLGLLTVFTQVGGLIWLLNRAWWYRRKKTKGRVVYRGLTFGLLYVFAVLCVIPLLARLNGRIPLPMGASNQKPLAPKTLLTCLANRHYVNANLYQLALKQGQALQKIDPALHLVYLDANFPFGNHFPLFPHRSHNDGKKLDLAFFRYDTRSQKSTTDYPSFLGYGFSEPPLAGELDQPDICRKRGAWQYNLLQEWVRSNPQRYTFDAELNAQLLQKLAEDPLTEKIFIEPHLKGRLGLGRMDNIRFHGCQAVRHDDHIHVQVK